MNLLPTGQWPNDNSAIGETTTDLRIRELQLYLEHLEQLSKDLSSFNNCSIQYIASLQKELRGRKRPSTEDGDTPI